MSTGKAQVFGADARFSQGRRAAGGACTGRARARRARRGGEGLMRMVCKPGSVRGALPPSMAIHLGPCLRRGSCCLPGPRGQGGPANSSREVPIRHCSGWGLPCQSGCPSCGGLLPHRFTLARPQWPGGLFSVALSLGLPRPGITRHPCLVEPGLSSRPENRRARPSDHPHRSRDKRRSALAQGLMQASAPRALMPRALTLLFPAGRCSNQVMCDMRGQDADSGNQ